jgi:hypothetical protein
MSDEQDLLAGGGPKLPSLKFEKIGDVHTGVVSDVKKLEDRDPAGVAKTWPNGDPRFVYVITPEDREGRRRELVGAWCDDHRDPRSSEASIRHGVDRQSNLGQILRRRREEGRLQRTETVRSQGREGRHRRPLVSNQ